jgi:radical SAM superfamily enzyme YgiQ (UPF0313 family)
MNTVICMLNSKYIHSALAPWYLLAGIEAFGLGGVTAWVVEGTVNERIEAVASRITACGHHEKKPDVIGLCCYIWNISFIKKLLPVLKNALPDALIILGGPEVSYNAADVLKDLPFVSYVISGEGELPFARLLDAVASGGDVAAIPGVCYRSGEDVVVTPPYNGSGDPPNPYCAAYFKALNGRIAYLETSRGCPFACAFCLSGRKQLALRAGGVRFFDMERAKRDILLLADSGTRTVKLVDRTFNAGRARARALLRFIIERYGTDIPRGVCFHFEIAGDLLDGETMDLLKTAPAGAIQFEIGLQSFNGRTLDAVNRRTNLKRLKENIESLISFGNIHIHIDLIAGLPYEDFESFTESFNTAYALKPHMLQLGFLKLLHGSAMREMPDTQQENLNVFSCRYSSEPPYQVTETPWISADELKKLHAAEVALERLNNSGRFRRTVEYVRGRTGLEPCQLFLRVGSFLSERGAKRLSLDDLTALLYELFSAMTGVDKVELRDIMVCDRLATNAGGKLPQVLKIHDSRLKTVMTAVNSNSETRPITGVRRGFALLYSENAAVYADYDDTERNPVTGEFELKKLQLPFSS